MTVRGPMRILITGMSGTGKSTVVAELARRGHRAIDLDDNQWSAWMPADGDPTGANPGHDWLWREDRVDRLLADAGDAPLFVGGCASNMGRFIGRFDRIVLLTAPVDTLLQRLASRQTNPYGKRPEEVARILENRRLFEPRLRRAATHEIDTATPLDLVIDRIRALPEER